MDCLFFWSPPPHKKIPALFRFRDCVAYTRLVVHLSVERVRVCFYCQYKLNHITLNNYVRVVWCILYQISAANVC